MVALAYIKENIKRYVQRSSDLESDTHWKRFHDANFVVTGGTGSHGYNNIWCYQWRQSWHHDNSVFIAVTVVTGKAMHPFDYIFTETS